jgi:CO/xanthine dehydrogenase Mo-binding subunit
MDAKVKREKQVGQSVPRLEGHAKVTGRAEYVHHLRLPGMLYGKIFRSSVPHGRIRAIRTEAAAAVGGVHSVFTGEDVRRVIPDPYFGPAFHDQPILALDKVRYAGEPVAVALAADPHVAEEAAALVAADYEVLPAVYDEVEATRSSVFVHERLRPAGTFPDLKHLEGRRDTNIALDYHLRRGDVEKAFAHADLVLEHTFRTQQVMHTPFEPMVSIAEPAQDGLIIHTSTQTPSFVRSEIARLLRWPESRVRVKTAFLGGGFGAKVYVKMEALAAAAALLTGRPVKIALSMEEQFYTISKHPTTVRIKSGVTREGRVTARLCEVWWNGGAYADIGPRVTQKSGFTAAGPYDIENVHIDSYAVYTNRPPAGAFRGFGIPQLVWAYECHTDLIAQRLGMDPLALRRKNILRDGRPHATGTPMRDANFDEVLVRLAARLDWDTPFERGRGTLRRGRGLAIGVKASIAPTSSMAALNVCADGSCYLYIGTTDMGQGSDTAMAQIVAETLNIELALVRVVHADTGITPYDMGTLGSRSTFHMAHAVRAAAEHAREQITAMAAPFGLEPADAAGIAEAFRRKFGMQAGNVFGVGNYTSRYLPADHDTGQSSDITPFWMIGATGAEVEIDTETGRVRVTRLVNVADVGRAINPRIVETQLSGAAIMALGSTLFESMDFDDGQLVNPSLAFYKIPAMHDLPEAIECEMVEAEQRNGPFGAKGVGESGTFAVSPAIANAIADAVGVRLFELPLTAEAIYRALAADRLPLDGERSADPPISGRP